MRKGEEGHNIQLSYDNLATKSLNLNMIYYCYSTLFWRSNNGKSYIMYELYNVIFSQLDTLRN